MSKVRREWQGNGESSGQPARADRFCLPGLRRKPGIQPHVKGAGHRVYGRPPEGVTARLTPDNWRHRFLVRRHSDGPVVVYLQEVTLLDAQEQRVRALEVVTEGPGRLTGYFLDLTGALAYANSEDAGLLATCTSPGTVADLAGLGAAEPGWTISFDMIQRSEQSR